MGIRPVGTFTLLGLGVCAALLASVFWLPAALVAPVLPDSWECERWSGRLWQGECGELSADGVAIGALGWTIHGFGTASLWWRRGDSRLNARVRHFGAGRLALDSMHGRLELVTLREVAGPRVASFAGGLRADGIIDVDLERLQLASGQLEAIAGRAVLRRIQVIGFGATLPDIAITWDAARAAQAPWSGRLRSLPGPLQVSGTLEFPNGSGYRLVGQAIIRESSSELGRLLARLARRDASGVFALELSGSW